MMRLPKLLATGLLVALIIGCQTFGFGPARKIVGTWSSEIGGFPLTVEYVSGQVRIEGYTDVPYSMEDNILTVAGVTRSISFPSSDEMIQTDPLTNTVQKFSRVK